jgi:hypothetical protein
MSDSYVNKGDEADREDAAASDLQARMLLRETATRSMMEEIGNYSFPSSSVRSSSEMEASKLHTIICLLTKGLYVIISYGQRPRIFLLSSK